MRFRIAVRLLGFVLVLATLAAASPAAASTLIVTSTSDSGAGSLRQAILDANGNPGADVIRFNVVGGGVQTIALVSSLPSITDTVTIDGYSQPGASANTNPPDRGSNAVLRIELDGQGTIGLTGLTVAARSNSNTRGQMATFLVRTFGLP